MERFQLKEDLQVKLNQNSNPERIQVRGKKVLNFFKLLVILCVLMAGLWV